MVRLLAIPLLLATALGAQVLTVGNGGKVYEFAEKDILVEIRDSLDKNQDEIKQKFEVAKKKTVEKMKHYRLDGLNVLPPAKADRVFYPDMTYVLEKEIVGPDGNVIYPKGYSYTITDYVSLPFEMVVFNADDPAQVAWVKAKKLNKKLGEVLMISGGSPVDAMKELKCPVYFALNKLQQRFSLQHTPSRIVQIGSKIKVTEVCLTCQPKKSGEGK